MKIDIEDEVVKISIQNWTPFTIQLFKLYAENLETTVEPVPVHTEKKKREIRLKWTEADDKFIQKNKDKMSIDDIAKHLGRTRDAIYNRLSRIRRLDVKPVEEKSEETIEEKPEPDATPTSPDMDLFLNWLETIETSNFTTDDFVTGKKLKREYAQEILTIAVQKGMILQMGMNKFKRVGNV